MTTPTTDIGLGSLQTEFGGFNPISMSEYYLNGAYVTASGTYPNGPIPTSGQISLGLFRDATNNSKSFTMTGPSRTSGYFRQNTGTYTITFTPATTAAIASFPVTATSTISPFTGNVSFPFANIPAGTTTYNVVGGLSTATTGGTLQMTPSGTIAGYTFAGTTPSLYTMSGPVTTYTVAFSANSGLYQQPFDVTYTLDQPADQAYRVDFSYTSTIPGIASGSTFMNIPAGSQTATLPITLTAATGAGTITVSSITPTPSTNLLGANLINNSSLPLVFTMAGPVIPRFYFSFSPTSGAYQDSTNFVITLNQVSASALTFTIPWTNTIGGFPSSGTGAVTVPAGQLSASVFQSGAAATSGGVLTSAISAGTQNGYTFTGGNSSFTMANYVPPPPTGTLSWGGLSSNASSSMAPTSNFVFVTSSVVLSGGVAPPGGYSVTVSYSAPNFSGSGTISIPAGSSVGTYTDTQTSGVYKQGNLASTVTVNYSGSISGSDSIGIFVSV